MHLLFIRHGESVDNVAGLYGGSRDAVLTAHGVLQVQRLALSLVESKLEVKHIFSSNLERASKTARAICDAQNKAHSSALTVVQLAELREKHFGNWEGVKYSPGPTEHRPTQTGAETLESLKARANDFLEKHLLPVLTTRVIESEKSCVVVVSHGISLGVLTLALAKKLRSTDGSLNQLPSTKISWSNTGYLDLVVKGSNGAIGDVVAGGSPWFGLNFSILQTNCTQHLKGLRKTRGGIGSIAHDEKQRTIKGYFVAPSRKRKAGDVF